MAPGKMEAGGGLERDAAVTVPLFAAWKAGAQVSDKSSVWAFGLSVCAWLRGSVQPASLSRVVAAQRPSRPS